VVVILFLAPNTRNRQAYLSTSDHPSENLRGARFSREVVEQWYPELATANGREEMGPAPFSHKLGALGCAQSSSVYLGDRQEDGACAAE
jgi:hypothetical protein